MTESNIRFTKFLVFVNAGVPAVLLAWDAWHHTLGANPVNFAILTTGMLTLVFLMLTLLVTPLRKLTGWNWLIFSRRTLGLYAFFYASCHFLIFFALDRGFSLSGTLAEMVKRKYLFIGSAGLLLLAPLAVTSTNAMVKRLGAKRWHMLHRLTYVAAIAGVIHYYMQVKADVRQPLAFAAALTLLLGYRVAARRTTAAPPRASRRRIWSGPLRLERIVRETPDVQTFRFVSPGGGRLPFEHRPGQYLVISPEIDGKRVNRSYTISSPPTRTDYCEITVKREENGYVSRHLHETLREGDLVNFSAPVGRFVFDGAETDSVVLIAGGVGITPLMSIVRYLTDRNWNGEIYFVYSAKTPADIIFRAELHDLQKRFPNFHLLLTLTRAEGTGWTGQKGRISGQFLKSAIPDLGARTVYLCGPMSMMEPTVQLLRDLGVPSGRIKLEEFTSAKRAETAPAPEAGGPAEVCAPVSPGGDDFEPRITFQRSGKSAMLSPGQSLLELAEEAGVNIDYECRSGICGRCKTRLLGGCVTMETEDALDADDKSKNIILMCQARAEGAVTVDA